MTTYVFTTGKGGEGKTTVASAFASTRALRGTKTLYVEIDYSTRAWMTLIPEGIRGARLDDAKTAYALLRDPGSTLDARNYMSDATYAIQVEALFAHGIGTAAEIAQAHRDHLWSHPVPLDMIPGTPRLRHADDELLLLGHDAHARINPLLVFRERLAPLLERYEDIVIDMPPTLVHVFGSVLAAANKIIIPVSLDPASRFEFEQTYESFREVYGRLKRLGEPTPHVAGVVVNRYNPELAAHVQRLRQYREGAIGVPVLGVIPLDSDVFSLAMEASMTCITFAPTSWASGAIIEFTKEVVQGGHA